MVERNPPSTHRRGPRARASEAGFTLLEAIVAMAIMVVILIGLLSLLQFNSRVAKAQVNVAGMQQSLRVAQAEMVREVRMAGRGGLPANRPGLQLPQGAALALQNNVPQGTTIAGGPQVLAGTDVLTIRGVFSTPLYQITATGDGLIREETFIVRGVTPTGIQQPLAALRDAIAQNRPEALLLVGANDDSIQAVVQLTGGANVDGDGLQLNFTTEGTHGVDYLRLSPNGAFPPELTTVAAVGILEEYQYYIRAAAPAPSLSKARLYPGTNAAHAAAPANLQIDVADNVLDLQVALGVDRLAPAGIVDARNDADEWLFNHEGDTPVTPADWNAPGARLYYLRINTLARTDRLDPDYTSPPIQAIEDHVYNETAGPAPGQELERKYRRRLLQAVVDLRNLG